MKDCAQPGQTWQTEGPRCEAFFFVASRLRLSLRLRLRVWKIKYIVDKYQAGDGDKDTSD